MNKKNLRSIFLEKRSKYSQNQILDLSENITEKIMSLESFKASKNIMVFLSFGSEFSTYQLIEKCFELGKNVIVPITNPKEKTILPSIIYHLDELEKGFYGILTPKENFIRPIDKDEIDLILVPGLIFDNSGYRVGYGGGYYDRFLSDINKEVLTIGVCFDLQMVDELEHNTYDIPVNLVVTEKKIVKIP